mgnify:CR=1 FL=1
MALLDESIHQLLRNISLDDILHPDGREYAWRPFRSIRLEFDPRGAHVIHSVFQSCNHVDE